jgi:membrane protein DedA with SNARE-associated domain
MFKHIIDWYTNTLTSGGYPIIVLLMAAESSVLPLPSEVIIPPAAHLAHSGQIPLSITGIIIAGTIGSWLGATIMYWAARLAGRPLFMRYGRLVLVTPEKIEGAENWSKHYGSMGIFISRLRRSCGISSVFPPASYG